MVSRARWPESISKSAPMRNWVFSESSKRDSKQENASKCKQIKTRRKEFSLENLERYSVDQFMEGGEKKQLRYFGYRLESEKTVLEACKR